MANFGEWKRLPLLTTKNNSLFVRHISRNDSLLCTSSRKHVDICYWEDGRSKHTWSFSQSHQLTSPTVFDPTYEDFAVVVNNTTLHRWQETTNDISKARKTSLEGNVYTLAQSGEQEPVLLFDDGRISRCSSPKDSLSPAHNKQILWVDMLQHEDTNIVCEVVKGSAGCEAMVYRIRENTESIHPELIRLQDKECIGYCLHKKYESVYLVILSSDGSLCKYTLSAESFREREETDTPVEIGEGPLLHALDDSHIVITQTKDDDDGQVGIGVWDLKFNTVKAWVAYPLHSEGTPFYVTVISNNLVVGFPSGVYMCQCLITPSTLGSVLGCVASCLSISEENSNMLEALVARLLDTSQTSSYNSFKIAFAEFFAAVKDNPGDTIVIQEKIRALVKRCLEEKQFFPRQELTDLASASLISADQFTNAIEKFDKNDDFHGIKTCLAHIQDIPEAIIVWCLQYFIDMDVSKFRSETDAEMSDNKDAEMSNNKDAEMSNNKDADMSDNKDAEMSNNKDEEMSNNKDEEMSDNKDEEMSDNKDEGRDQVPCPFPPGQADLIQRTLMTPVSEVFLLESLRTLEFNSSIQLLRYLRYLLATFPENSDHNNSEQLSEEKVVSWLCYVLDANFTRMIMLPDAGHILIDIQEIVESKMSHYEESTELDSIIQVFLEKFRMPRNKNISDYCIEKLVF